MVETYRLGHATAEQQGQMVSGGSRNFSVAGFCLASRRGTRVLYDAYFCEEIGCHGKRERESLVSTRMKSRQSRLLMVAERNTWGKRHFWWLRRGCTHDKRFLWWFQRKKLWKNSIINLDYLAENH